jgi:hypothetical protein
MTQSMNLRLLLSTTVAIFLAAPRRLLLLLCAAGTIRLRHYVLCERGVWVGVIAVYTVLEIIAMVCFDGSFSPPCAVFATGVDHFLLRAHLDVFRTETFEDTADACKMAMEMPRRLLVLERLPSD